VGQFLTSLTAVGDVKLNISGVDVMITIFCDFCQFSAKKLSFFSKTNVVINILHNLALFRVKNANFFAEFFGENILKIITSVPEVCRLKTPVFGGVCRRSTSVMFKLTHLDSDNGSVFFQEFSAGMYPIKKFGPEFKKTAKDLFQKMDNLARS
jgi:hypothetical protein